MCEQARLDRRDRWSGGLATAGADSCAHRTAPSLMIAIMSPSMRDSHAPARVNRNAVATSAASGCEIG